LRALLKNRSARWGRGRARGLRLRARYGFVHKGLCAGRLGLWLLECACVEGGLTLIENAIELEGRDEDLCFCLGMIHDGD
jgi:hypothetical protein